MKPVGAEIGAVLLLFLCGGFMPAQPQPLGVEKWEDPSYPPIARAAGIEGEVEVHFRVDELGRTVNVGATAGHPMLVRSAEDAVKSWVFALTEEVRAQNRATTFRYSLVEQVAGVSYAESATTSVDYDTFESVSVSAKRSKLRVEGCVGPEETASSANEGTIGPWDYIGLTRYGHYRVRLDRSGQVGWEGHSRVVTTGTDRAVVDRDAVDNLFEELDRLDFWGACNLYAPYLEPMHSSAVALSAIVGLAHKTIEDREGAGPAWLQALARRVDFVADTHRWRHGDPTREPLSNITDETSFAKSGLTDLMRAAASGDAERLNNVEELQTHAADTDASGWTALMYAAANYNGTAVSLFLEAGADVNHRDRRGHTPLMAAAIGDGFSEELASAGAEVNARSEAGLTALMILASRGEPEEIELALRAGADPTVLDEEGRSALDYLVASNCSKDPLRNRLLEYFVIEGDGCGQMDQDEFQRSWQLLNEAAWKRRLNRPRR